MTKRILIVTSEFPPQPGGIGNHAYYLALYLSKSNYDVTVIADQRLDDNNIEVAFDVTLPFTVQRIRMHKVRFFMYLQRILKTFQALKKVDFVIATGKFSLWNVAFCTRFIKCPSLAVIHGSEVNFKSFGNRKTVDASLRQFSTIVSVSNYTKQLITHLNLNVQIIPNGIDVSQWDSSEKCEINLKGFPVLTTVGRVSSRKGQLNVIRLLPDLLPAFPDIHYHCVGIPGEAEAFLAVAKSLHVERHLTFHGVLNDRDLRGVLSETDIFVMLSTESDTGDVEGFGIAILEANAMGVSAIGSRGCGIEDAIKNGVTGFLIEDSDAKAFQAGVTQIINNKDVFIEKSKQWAQAHDWDHLIKRYIALIP